MKTVTFKTAKLAKEKGFDIDTSPRRYYNYKGEYNGSVIHELKYIIKRVSVPKELQSISAPYQCELSDWLREKHQIYVDIHTYPTFSTKSYVLYIYDVFTKSDGQSFNGGTLSIWSYPKYEEALEQALIDALNLIV